MATKNNPGKYDCYQRAAPDEPLFVLLGRDPTAFIVVQFWADVRERMGRTEPEKLRDARSCADSMKKWAIVRGKEVGAARDAARETLWRQGVEVLLAFGRRIWGNGTLPLAEIIVRAGVTMGDLCRVARRADKDAHRGTTDAQREMGNMVFSFIRWCDDCGLDPVRCIEEAIEAQKKFAAENECV